jgi:hypothetical protein
MTSAERLQLRGIRTLQTAFSTRSSFILSSSAGALGTFVGVVQHRADPIVPTLGGDENEREMTITCEREQFTTAGVTPDQKMSVTYQGTRWVIDDMPGVDSDEACFTFNLCSPVSSK